MKAIWRPSGDQASRSPLDGSTWFVLSTGAMNVAAPPPGSATITPSRPSMVPT
jgi:hypothetical protein